MGQYLTTTEAADRLGITGRTIRNMIDRGEIEAHRAGSHFRIDEDVIAAYVAANTNKLSLAPTTGPAPTPLSPPAPQAG